MEVDRESIRSCRTAVVRKFLVYFDRNDSGDIWNNIIKIWEVMFLLNI